jgi:hypothetical protein
MPSAAPVEPASRARLPGRPVAAASVVTGFNVKLSHRRRRAERDCE